MLERVWRATADEGGQVLDCDPAKRKNGGPAIRSRSEADRVDSGRSKGKG